MEELRSSPPLPTKRLKVLHDIESTASGNDRIPSLPESIMLNILSYFPTKHLLQTSVLSKSFRELWTIIPRLDFDDEPFKIHRVKNKRQIQNPKFENFVGNVMRLLQDGAHNVDRFRLSWSHCDMSLVNQWIDVLGNKNLKEIVLDLRHNQSAEKIRYPITLPLCMFSCDSLVSLKLKLQDCELIMLPTSICLNKLKILHLMGVRFSGEGAIQKLLAGCPILETLVMMGCHIYDEKVVAISVPSLRNFTMRHIYLPSGSRIKMSNRNLLVFNYTVMECNMKNNYIDKLSSLIEASIEVLLQPGGSYSVNRYDECFDNVRALFSGLASIWSLTLPRSTLQILSNALDLLDLLPSFDNLNKLMLTSLRTRDYFQVIAYLLKSSPSIESLVIDLMDLPRIGVVVKEEGQAVLTGFLCTSGLVLNHLKEVKINCFRGTEAELEFLKLILKKANALQKLTIREMNDSKKGIEIKWRISMLEKASASCTISVL